jgi:hypothetical protein
MLDDGLFHRGPDFFVPGEPAVLGLVEHQQGLVADLGEFGTPAGTALDGVVGLDGTDDDDLVAAADLPADGLQHFAEDGGTGILAVHELGDVGQAHVLERQLFGGKHAHAALALDLMTFKAVVDFFDAPAFGQSAEKLFGPGSAAAVENTLFGIEHASLLIKIASCGTPGTSFTSWQNLPRSARRGSLSRALREGRMGCFFRCPSWSFANKKSPGSDAPGAFLMSAGIP